MKMTRNEIIQGLQFTIEMFLLNPNTGEKYEEPRNDMDKTTIDACRGAIDLLKQEPCEDAVSRQAVLDLIEHYNSDGLGSVFNGYEEGVKFADAVNNLPPVTPTQETVLDKIRDEIERQEKWLMDAGYNAYNVDIAFSSIKSVLAESEGV